MYFLDQITGQNCTQYLIDPAAPEENRAHGTPPFKNSY